MRARGTDLLEETAFAAPIREVIGESWEPWAIVVGALLFDRIVLARLSGRGVLGWLGRILGVGS